MPDRAAFIPALILDRAMCVECIATKAVVSIERAEKTLEIIAAALVLRGETGRCVVCGETRLIRSVGRPQS